MAHRRSSPLPDQRRLLLAFDLEPFYGIGRRPDPGATPLPELVDTLLGPLHERGLRATFFTVGDVARDHPDLLRRLAAEGHEIACHGDRHRPLDQLDPETFEADLRRNLEAITALGLPRPAGFRAPLLSLDARTAWAHAALARLGLRYSSSVLPARSPLYGWPEFGEAPRRIDGILELPVALGRFGPWRLPCFAGTYFRVLPGWWTRRAMRAAAARGPVGGYLHPYDFDAAQPWAWHAELEGRRLLNHLLFVGRKGLARRLARVLDAGWTVSPYGEYVAECDAAARRGTRPPRIPPLPDSQVSGGQ